MMSDNLTEPEHICFLIGFSSSLFECSVYQSAYLSKQRNALISQRNTSALTLFTRGHGSLK